MMYDQTHLPYTIKGEFNRFAFDLVHAEENKDLYRTACDKLSAKKYVADKVGEKYVAQLVEDTDHYLKYSLLSDMHSAVIDGVVQRPIKLDTECVKMKTWYFWEDKKPGKFFREEILGDGLHTYKFFCYQGRILSVYYYYENKEDDSTSIRTMVSFPDLQPTGWIDRYETKGEFRHSENWKEIVWLAETLAADFPIVRVDIFDTPKGVKFSEFTATFRSFTMSPESDAALMELINGSQSTTD